jgi:transcriptional regulator
MYTPSHFKQEDLAAIHEMMARIGFASLVTNSASGLIATHAPTLFDPADGEHGTLRGHIARANAQWKTSLTDSEAMAIFTGPHGYVSPQWYASKREHGRVVPTWNYIAIHAYGHVKFSDDRELLLNIVTRLTEKHEAGFEHPWHVSDAPADYIQSMLGAIIAFEMPISRIEATWKLSQNKTEADRVGAMNGLKEQGNDVADAMEKAFTKTKPWKEDKP